MKPALTVLFFAVLTSVISGSPRTWTFGDGSVLKLDLPESIRVEQISPPSDTKSQAFTLRFPDLGSISTISFNLTVSRADSSSEWSTVPKVDAFLVKEGAFALRNSIEKQLVPMHFNTKNGIGRYVALTDRQLVGSEIQRPEVFKYMVRVACLISGHKIFVRGYTNSTQEEYYVKMMHIIETAEILSH